MSTKTRIVQAAHRPRAGWAEAAKRMHARGEDVLLDDTTPTVCDRDGWEWRTHVDPESLLRGDKGR